MSNGIPFDPSAVGPADRANARREMLLAQRWPTSADVGRSAGGLAVNPAQWAKTQCDAGRLLGGWDETIGTFRYPPFQFDDEGHVRPMVPLLLQAMAEHPKRTADADPGGWRRVYWLYQPLRSLSRRALRCASAPLEPGVLPEVAFAQIEGWLSVTSAAERRARTPAEVFVDDPDIVVALARQSAALARPNTNAGF